MKIGYLMQNGAPDLSKTSGPQLHTVAVIKGLTKKGNQVRTIALQRNSLGWSDDLTTWSKKYCGYTRNSAFHLFESVTRRIQYEFKLPFIGYYDSLHFSDTCVRLLGGWDLIYERHGYLGYGGVFTARRLDIPLVIELNGNIIKEIDEIGVEMSSIQRDIGRWRTIKTLMGANHIIAVSAALKNLLIKNINISEDKISVVENGVNLELFSRQYDGKYIREKFSVNKGPIIIFVGSFQPWHGVDLLVDAIRMISSRYPNLRLLLIGNGDGRASIENKIAEFGLVDKIIILGQLSQENVAELISIADIAVAPYPYQHSEIVGTPLKLLEYMAAGKAILATSAKIHEIISDGYTGLRVPPADKYSLANGLCQLIENEEVREQLGENAKIQAQYYSWDQVVERLNSILISIVNKYNGSSRRKRQSGEQDE
jgi:glycosyltransferase involved in cell wall biosynthesis